MGKTIRFGDLVRNGGRPQTLTLWTEPKKDRFLQQAIQKNRVLTVVQEPTSKHKDFARIGFHQQPSAMYLLFPRPLPRDSSSRVIGINYQLIEEPEVTDPARPHHFIVKAKAPKEELPKHEVPKPNPTKKTFTVKIRRTATFDMEIKVEAENQPTAEKEAMESVNDRPFELSKSRVTQEIVQTK